METDLSPYVLIQGVSPEGPRVSPFASTQGDRVGGHPEGRKARRISEGPLRACALRASAQGDKRKASG